MQFILYGATGDLAMQKIYPALFSLWKQQALGSITSIMLVSRRTWTDEEMKQYVQEKMCACMRTRRLPLFIKKCVLRTS